MTARQFVWSDPEVQKLAEQFVAIADDCFRMDHGKDAESRYFQKLMAEVPHGSTQGTYFLTPGGEVLEWTDQQWGNPKITIDIMRKSLAKWNALSEQERMSEGKTEMVLDSKSSGIGSQEHYPKGGLILRCSYRDLPRNGSHPMADRRNEDFAWFRKEEARQFLPNVPKVGESHEIPSMLARRLARFHLVDRVRGGIAPFADEDVKQAQIKVTISKVQGGVVSLDLKGETHTSVEGRWSVNGSQNPTLQKRGCDVQLLGKATYNLRTKEFVTFKMVAVGTRWGGTEYNLRQDDLDTAPIGIAFTLAGKGRLERFQPEHLWAYDH